jgi:hypothetical protein
MRGFLLNSFEGRSCRIIFKSASQIISRIADIATHEFIEVDHTL